MLEKLAVPPQTSLEWVNGTRHGNGTTNGHCTDCETTEQQLKIGAVNTVRDHETRLTNALKVGLWRGLLYILFTLYMIIIIMYNVYNI